MSLSTKSIFPLFESVCVLDGHIRNTGFHSKRFLESYKKFYFELPDFDLFDNITIPTAYQNGKVKLRISYNQNERKHSFQPYAIKQVHSLKVVVDNTIDYDLKFEDRSQLDDLYKQRKDCDDILIVRNDHVTDTYYANIVFWDGTAWYTPNTYLLNGTKRSQLLKSGKIEEVTIQFKDLENFQAFQLINAMMDFDPHVFIPIGNIKH